MTVTMEQIRAALDGYEPSYATAARELGTQALPHLAEIIRQGDASSARRAVYLASFIDHEQADGVVAMGMDRAEATVHVAVAAGTRNLAPSYRNPLLLRLLDKDDIGVRKAALRAVPARPDASLAAKVERLARNEPEPELRRLAGEVLERTLS